MKLDRVIKSDGITVKDYFIELILFGAHYIQT